MRLLRSENLSWPGVIGIALLSLVPIVSASATPRDPSRAAAIFPPWWSQSRVLSAGYAAGDVTAKGGAAFVLVVRGAPETLNANLRRAGALMILEPGSLGLCEAKEPAR